MLGYRLYLSDVSQASLSAAYRGVFGDKFLGKDGGNDRVFSLLDVAPMWTRFFGSSSRLSLRANVQAYVYPPDRKQNWYGMGGSLRFGHTFSFGRNQGGGLDLGPSIALRNIELFGDYRFSANRFRGNALGDFCGADAVEPSCVIQTGRPRRDFRHSVRAGVTYTGNQIVSLLYQFHWVDSNSFGYSSMRHQVELSMSSQLPAQLIGTLKGVVVYNMFLDPFLIARDVQTQDFVAIDDESRNGLIVQLSRDFGDAMTIEARYAIYSNEFATKHVSFRRQVAFLGASYWFGKE